MNNRNRFKAGLAAVAVLAMPILTNGCGDDASNPLCCNEFKVGATVTADIGGSAQSQVAVQAVSDFSGIAAAAIDDLTTACRSIASDLDATRAEMDAEEAKTDRRAKLDGWCKLAVSKIGTFKAMAGGTLTLQVQPPKCSASVSAKANCQAKCDVSGKCDIKANPPKCTGGKLEISCKGSCTAMGGVAVSCEGSCMGNCSGECTAQGGVQCAGRCEGTCSGSTDSGGNCQGMCQGTCKATAPSVMCSGSCKGSCSASCMAMAGASVKCDGMCAGDFEPLKCEGGKLEGGCQVEAKCDANCNASVSAKAECTPPSVVLAFSGAANIQAVGQLKATLEANLPLVFAFRARLQGMADIAGTFTANVGAVTDIKAACIPAVISAVGSAGQDVSASFSAAGSIAGTFSTN